MSEALELDLISLLEAEDDYYYHFQNVQFIYISQKEIRRRKGS